jgi:hypothetical protein
MVAIVSAAAGKDQALRIDEDDSNTGAIVGGAEHETLDQMGVGGSYTVTCQKLQINGPVLMPA